MWFADRVSMKQTWEHDRQSREVERVSGRATKDWFKLLDRHNSRRRGLIATIEWLQDEQKIPHRLASTLAWNYFHPTTLPDDIQDELGTLPAASVRVVKPARKARLNKVRVAPLKRAAASAKRKPAKTRARKAKRRS